MNRPQSHRQSHKLYKLQNQHKKTHLDGSSMQRTTLQFSQLSHFPLKFQRFPQIKFYEGYSSYNDELMQKNNLGRQNSQEVPKSNSVPNSPIKPYQGLTQKQLININGSTVIKLEQPFRNQIQPQRMIAESGVCKVEETDFKNRVCQSYSMNRIYASINLQSRETMKRKLTRGMYSIASRKYQPIIDSREIFDDQDLNNNVIGPDECRLWRNLMNKYFLRTTKTGKTKTKTILKSQIKLASDDMDDIQEISKKVRKRRSKKKDVPIKKEEQDLCQIISEQSKLKFNDQFKKGQLSELKKEEDMAQKGMSLTKPSKPESIQLQK